MSLIERWRQRADNKEAAKILEISLKAQKIWNDKTTISSLRVVQMRKVYSDFGLELTDQDCQYLACNMTYLLAVKTDATPGKMEPDAIALRSEIDMIKTDRLDVIVDQDLQMKESGKERADAYGLHVAQISQAVMNIYENSSIPAKPNEFYLRTAMHANMLNQIRSGAISIAK